MGRLFGTDGVRGIANAELTCELAMQIGKAAAYVLTKETHHKPKILIGKDSRISGDMLEAALTAGLCSVGASVVSLGIIPTPAVAYLTRKYEADAGIVISASHNSAEYNGIKIFNANGYKLSDAIEERIETIILDNSEPIDAPTGDAVGTLETCDTALADYIEFAKSTIDCDLSDMRIAIDCANGASYKSAVKVIVEMGAEAFVVHNHPNGTNINEKCGSTHTKSFQQYVKNIDVDLGLTFDGDADRVLAIDEKGNLIDGDKIMFICANFLKAKGLLVKDTLVTTVMTNLGLVLAAREKGINIVQTRVGDRYVLEEMLKSGYILGGEQSGHIIFLENNTTGDGLLSALQLLAILKKSGKKLSELAEVFQTLPQVTVNAKVQNSKKNSYTEDDVICAEIAQLEAELSGNGRVLIRPSGTEPCVRVMLEGPDLAVITQKANYLAKLIEARLG
ncbi:MAG: phosphoglucosamine mutase [Ruminococcaceae bacterium]|nr:phosphoglucosamine mutase [Oscillospiraceae bacterium]